MVGVESWKLVQWSALAEVGMMGVVVMEMMAEVEVPVRQPVAVEVFARPKVVKVSYQL